MPRRATILLVDDDDADLMISARRLRAAAPDRYRLLQASNLDEAVATLRVSPVDAVVLDLNLGTTAGPDTVARLRREAESTMIIATTGFATPEVERACLRAGADQFLEKDALAAGDALMQALEYALRRPKAKSPTLAAQVQGLLASLESEGRESEDDAVGDLDGTSPARLRAAARNLAAQGRPPAELFGQLIEDAAESRDPSLTLGALAVYLAQEYFEALSDARDS